VKGGAIFAWNGQESFVTSFKSSHILIYEKLKPMSKIKGQLFRRVQIAG
jgi:hypothetical protein